MSESGFSEEMRGFWERGDEAMHLTGRLGFDLVRLLRVDMVMKDASLHAFTQQGVNA